jgi:hypothetical protein
MRTLRNFSTPCAASIIMLAGLSALAQDFVMPSGSGPATFTESFPTKQARQVRIRGVAWAGGIQIQINGQSAPVDLITQSSGKQASEVLLSYEFPAGQSQITVRRAKGVQIYRLEGTQKYVGTSSEAYPHALFTIDLDRMKSEYNVDFRIAPSFEPLAWFSAKWDNYARAWGSPEQSWTTQRGKVWTLQEASQATLHYEFMHAGLDLPTDLTLVYDPRGRTTVVHMRQTLHATRDVLLEPEKDAVEFLHVVVSPEYGHDWQDGVTDYQWNREEGESDPDTLAGSHTHFVRLVDRSARTYMYNVSTEGRMMQRSGAHHTGAAHPSYATNTIGGWISKQGVGSAAFLFHGYKSSARRDLTPVPGHCGDGADTHFYIGWGHLYLPLQLRSGDEITADYSLYALASVLTREQVEDLNEADLHYFGTASQAKCKIVNWYGTKNVCGLIREDGSSTLIGIGKEPEHFSVSKTAAGDLRAWQVVDIGQNQVKRLAVEPSGVEVFPGFVTIVDAGTALVKP